MSTRKRTKTFFSRKKIFKSLKSLGRKINFNSKLFLVLGISFTSLWFLNTTVFADNISFNSTVDISTILENETSIPVSLEIPSLNLVLPIKQTIIRGGEWEVFDEGISHLATSGYPGQKNNTIFYAHNTYDRLGRLDEVANKSIIRVKTKGGTIAIYEIYEKKIVSPNDIDYLTKFDGEILTIYTCIGFADSKRLVAKAKRII